MISQAGMYTVQEEYGWPEDGRTRVVSLRRS